MGISFIGNPLDDEDEYASEDGDWDMAEEDNREFWNPLDVEEENDSEEEEEEFESYGIVNSIFGGEFDSEDDLNDSDLLNNTNSGPPSTETGVNIKIVPESESEDEDDDEYVPFAVFPGPQTSPSEEHTED